MEQQPRRASPLGAVELSSRSDEDLLELVAERRDEAAFDEFYGRYGRALYAVVVRLIGDRAGSEDVVQQAFTNVWRAAAGYRRERGPATGWLFAIARNAAVDALRSRAAPSRWEVPDLPDEGPGPDERASAAEDAFRIHARRSTGCRIEEREVIGLGVLRRPFTERGGRTTGGAAGHGQDPYPPRARPPRRPPRSRAGDAMSPPVTGFRNRQLYEPVSP